jgi:phosphoserine phosphatase RsbU/P
VCEADSITFPRRRLLNLLVDPARNSGLESRLCARRRPALNQAAWCVGGHSEVAILKVIEGACPGQIVELVGDRCVIGRHPNCEVVLDNAAVSRHHAQILETHGSFFLEDLRSRNRTFLNDIPVQGRTELHELDVIKICDVLFEFHMKMPADSSSSWLLSGSSSGSSNRIAERETAANVDIPSTPSGAEPKIENSSGNSSIITTMDAKTGSDLRLGVKADVKLKAVLEISRALAHTLKLNDVLKRTLKELFKIFPQAEEGFVLLKDLETGKLRVRATRIRSQQEDDSVRISRTIVEKAMQDCEAILSHDAINDPQFERSDSLSKLRIRSIMCVPLFGAEGAATGVIQLDARDLREQFSQNDLDMLVSVGSQISLAVENAQMHDRLLRQRDLEQEKKQKAAEMDLAVQVQLDFLPNTPPEVPGYDFYDFYEAALEVGGDYFDYIELPDKRIVIPLGDVAGKGVPAALLMAKLSSSARFQFLTRPSIAEALSALNAEIASGGLGHRFITLGIIVLNPTTHEITVANAGHPPVLLRRPGGIVEELGNEVAGTPLGVVPDLQYKTSNFTLNEGESILLYSDGIIDAMNAKELPYGRKRLREYLARAQGPVKEIAGGLLRDIEDYTAEQSGQTDDISLVCFQRLKADKG